MSLSSRSERACHPERRRREGSASESPTMLRLGLMAITCLLFAAALASAQQPPSGPGLMFHARYAELAGNPRNLSDSARSEEHTSELQSRSDLVCRLLLEKKKNLP